MIIQGKKSCSISCLVISLNLTKLDVLDTLDEIKIAVAYQYKGKTLDSFPADLNILAQVEVVYETLPGWKSDISKCKTFQELPVNAQKYVERIEQFLGVYGKVLEYFLLNKLLVVEWIGVGPGRDAMIHRPKI